MPAPASAPPVALHPVHRRPTAVLALALGLLATACGSGGNGSTAAPGAAQGAPATDAAAVDTAEPADSETAAAVDAEVAAETDVAADTTDAADTADIVVAVPAALQFTAPLVGGGELDAAAYAGKPTVLWFWAPT